MTTVVLCLGLISTAAPAWAGKGDSAVGDCLAIEEGKTSNLRRVSTLMCDTRALQPDRRDRGAPRRR